MREGFIPFGFIRRIKKASRRGARNPGELGWFLSPWILLLLMASLAARLSVSMAGPSHSGPVPPLSEVEQASGERLCQDVDALAGAIGERNLRRAAALEAAARVVRDLAKRDAWPAQTAGFFIGAQRWRVGTISIRVGAQMGPKEALSPSHRCPGALHLDNFGHL